MKINLDQAEPDKDEIKYNYDKPPLDKPDIKGGNCPAD